MKKETAKQELENNWQRVQYWWHHVVGEEPKLVFVKIEDGKIYAITDKIVKWEFSGDLSKLKVFKRGSTYVVKINDVQWIEGGYE